MAAGKISVVKTQEAETSNQIVEDELKPSVSKRASRRQREPDNSPNPKHSMKSIETVSETLTLSQLMPSSQTPAKPVSNVLCIPVHNKEMEIGPIIVKAKPFVDRILVCDDGSEDLTGQIAEGLGATVIRHKTPLGRVATLRVLLERAFELDPALALVMDVNADYNVAEIPRIISPINLKEADIIFAHPPQDNSEDIIDSVFMAFSRKAIKAFLSAPPEVLESQSRITAVAASNTIFIKGISIEKPVVPVVVLEPDLLKVRAPQNVNIHNESIIETPAKSGLSITQRVVRVLTNHSLLFFGLPGLLVSAVGVYAGWHLLTNFLNLNYLSYPAAFIMIIGVISGLFLITTSIILKAFSNLVSNE